MGGEKFRDRVSFSFLEVEAVWTLIELHFRSEEGGGGGVVVVVVCDGFKYLPRVILLARSKGGIFLAVQ